MSSSTAEKLPQELWALILQHVDYWQRLSACALVCRKLARAAAAATQSLELYLDCDHSPTNHDAFLSWTNRHGSSLTSLHLESIIENSPIRQLACPNLLQLSVTDCTVQLCASSEGLGLLHSCTALTKLKLTRPKLLAGGVLAPAGLVPSAVARLHSFTMTGCVELPGEPEDRHSFAQTVIQMLVPHLSSLTHLHLFGDSELPSCFKPHISTVVRLQQLSLQWIGERTATVRRLRACLLACLLAEAQTCVPLRLHLWLQQLCRVHQRMAHIWLWPLPCPAYVLTPCLSATILLPLLQGPSLQPPCRALSV
jgi:hypothetical protein